MKEKSDKLTRADADAMLHSLIALGGVAEIIVPPLVTGEVISEGDLPEPELPYVEHNKEPSDSTGLLSLFREAWQITEQ